MISEIKSVNESIVNMKKMLLVAVKDARDVCNNYIKENNEHKKAKVVYELKKAKDALGCTTRQLKGEKKIQYYIDIKKIQADIK